MPVLAARKSDHGLVKPLAGELVLEAVVWYLSERPDLDDALLCDALQMAGVIGNDRQIREKHLSHFIDRSNPRVELAIYPRYPQGYPPE